ncbi:MAG: hypothetical protein R3F43_21035 [bacterium]
MSTQPIFALLSRQGPDQPWPAGALYAHLAVRWPPAGRAGGAGRSALDSTWTQSRRVVVEASASLADATLFREVTGAHGVQLQRPAGKLHLLGRRSRCRGPGVLFAGGDTYGLGLAVLAGGRPDRAGRSYFCGGPYFDVANAFAVSRSGARLSGRPPPSSPGWTAARRPWVPSRGRIPWILKEAFSSIGPAVLIGDGPRWARADAGGRRSTGRPGPLGSGLCVTVDP